MNPLRRGILENIMRVILAPLLVLLLSACGNDSPQGGPPGGGVIQSPR